MLEHPNQKFVDDAVAWLHNEATMEESLDFYESTYNMAGCDDWTIAELGKHDRFFLATHILNRADLIHTWLYARFREIEKEPDGYLDLWAREHGKSSIGTFSGITQEIIKNPDITVGIFSHVKPVARKFLLQLKHEFESNEKLKSLYPDIFYANPQTESPKWSEEKGIVVKRKSNTKEATVEAHGLVDGQPTGAHFLLRVYDDVVTRESVSTPDQVFKTTAAWELSDNLSARGEDGKARAWHFGTRYSYADTYQQIIDRQALKVRIYPATKNGLPDGEPILLTPEVWAEKRRTQGPSTIACQQLLNPAAGAEAMFRKEWLRYIDIRPATLNIYIMCDPAQSRKKGSDNTAISVIGIDAGLNRYLLDGYCHKMNLGERWHNLKTLRKHWMRQPGIQTVTVGYERYGLQSDLEHFELEMQKPKEEHFQIIELAWPREGPGAKIDRIQRLQPDFQAGKFYLIALVQKKDAEGKVIPGEHDSKRQAECRRNGEAWRILRPVSRRDHEGDLYSLNKVFQDEFLVYPFAVHDDFLDATSRIYDMDPVGPIIIDEKHLEPEVT